MAMIDDPGPHLCRQDSTVALPPGRGRREGGMRAASVVLMILLAAACASPEDTAAPSPSGSASHTAPGVPPSGEPECEEETADVPASRPQDWVGVRWSGAGRDYEIVRWQGNRATTVHKFRFEAPVQGASLPEDISLDSATGTILYALCCEAGGTVLAVDDPEHRLGDQGYRVDVLGGASLMARVDRFGTVVIRPEFPRAEQEVVLQRIQAADVAVAPDASVLVLIDPLQVEDPDGPAASPGVLVLQQGADCHWTQRLIPVESGRYCSLVALAGGQVGLIKAPPTWSAAEHQACQGDTLDVLAIASGHLTPAALVFPTALSHLSSDRSGTYLLATGCCPSRWVRT